jgi:tRNA(Ile2) C34 agmatinyltransferase TiaS
VNALANKDIAVLELLRAEGEMTAKRIGQIITERTPCGACNGSGEGDGRDFRCRKCYGRGTALFDYGKAYACLQKLRQRGLVVRRHLLDEWGDSTSTLVWAALPVADVRDPLEQAFRAPSAGADQ